MKMTEAEVLIKTEAIAALLSEYLVYYKPIYEKTVTRQISQLRRADKKAHMKSAMKDFHNIQVVARRFSNVLENNHTKNFDNVIDHLHESINKIKITETK